MPEVSSKNDLVVFVHIPKTGGTTLNSMLAHQYSADEIYEVMMRGMSATTTTGRMISASKIRRLKSAIKHQNDLRVIHGHFDLSLGRLMPGNARLFTLLRDPVERAISHYFHYRGLTTDPIHPLAMASTLTEWVSTCNLLEMDNGQTRRLAGELSLPCGQVTSRTLDRAKANLAKFAVVGLTERFDESQILLRRVFDWPLCRYPARNVGESRVQRTAIDPDDLKTIVNCNRFDLELYQFASELFEQAISGIDMAQELSRLRAAPIHVVHPRPEPVRVPSSAYRRAISTLRSLLSAKALPKLVVLAWGGWLSTIGSGSDFLLTQL